MPNLLTTAISDDRDVIFQFTFVPIPMTLEVAAHQACRPLPPSSAVTGLPTRFGVKSVKPSRHNPTRG